MGSKEISLCAMRFTPTMWNNFRNKTKNSLNNISNADIYISVEYLRFVPYPLMAMFHVNKQFDYVLSLNHL